MATNKFLIITSFFHLGERNISDRFCKGKTVSLLFWSSPEGSGKLRFQDFMTAAKDDQSL